MDASWTFIALAGTIAATGVALDIQTRLIVAAVERRERHTRR